MDESQKWFLLKNEDGQIFGPVTFEQIFSWARDAQVSPHDKVSNDEMSWVKAPMVPELEMDYLVHVGEDQYYGPTTLGAVREFLEAGEITLDSLITNCRDGSVQPVRAFPEFSVKAAAEHAPVRTNLRLSLQARIRDLEEMLLEERRGREIAEMRVHKLEARLAELGVRIS